ncbi:MAG TPA: NAD(P)-dependent oxidoreductase, partial [Candidatus Latescibacteria bacterium]|nr:NAD(P)-dependent oxidoreductase [Candidatus Latescibacterota bacterium]
MSPKKVLVTGVYGLIAGAIYRKLSKLPDQYEVYALARRSQ